MRLTWRDGLATLFVALAAGLYALWLSGTDLPGLSGTRIVAAVILGLGWAACVTSRGAMDEIYGGGARRRVPLPYVVTASVIGLVSLVAGVIAVAAASEAMLATNVAATIALWAISTARHAIRAGTPAPGSMAEAA